MALLAYYQSDKIIQISLKTINLIKKKLYELLLIGLQQAKKSTIKYYLSVNHSLDKS